MAQGDTSGKEVVAHGPAVPLPSSTGKEVVAYGPAVPLPSSTAGRDLSWCVAPPQAAVWLAAHHPALRGALRDKLAQALGEVSVLDSGGALEQSLRQQRSLGEPWPVVLVELSLPGITLARLRHWLEQRPGGLSCLLCTDHAGADVRAHAHLLGVEAVVEAPFVVEHLYCVLRFLAQSRRRRHRVVPAGVLSAQGALEGDLWSARS